MAYFKIYEGDAKDLLPNIPDNYIDCIITDPPYFIDGMGDDWNDRKLQSKKDKAGVIGGLPVGMKFDRMQGKRLQEFMEPIAEQCYRILKPGAFCVVFSQARLYHRMAMAFDINGFEIRDMLAWKYEGQPKAFSMDHFIMNSNIPNKKKLCKELEGWKTPQLKPQMEPMVLAQKPKEGTFLDNWLKYQVGLVNMNIGLAGRFPGNVMEYSKKGKNTDNLDHLTIKPVDLISHLIHLFTKKDQIILDPFMGSGSHGEAALRNNRRFLGIEKEGKYVRVAKERLECIRKRRKA